VSFFGLYLAFHKKVKTGCLFLFIGLLFFYLEVLVWIPYFHGTEGIYPHWLYTDFGSKPFEALRAVLKNPFLPVRILFSNWTKIGTYLLLFGPFLFFPLYSRQLFLMVPLIAAKELTSNPDMWEMTNQYTAFLCPVLVMAAAEGLSNWRKKPVLDLSFFKSLPSSSRFILGLNLLIILGNSPWRGVEHLKFWSLNGAEKTSSAVFALIPPGASVETETAIAPHLTHRQTIYSLDKSHTCDFIDPDYFVACQGLNCYPLRYSDIENCLNEKFKKGYKNIFERDGWIVLESPNYPGVASK